MHDTFLFKKIADHLFEVCKENKIIKITHLEVSVHKNSHVNKKSLLKHLLDEIPELIDYDTVIIVHNGQTEELTAIINTVEGVHDETLCD